MIEIPLTDEQCQAQSRDQGIDRIELASDGILRLGGWYDSIAAWSTEVQLTPEQLNLLECHFSTTSS